MVQVLKLCLSIFPAPVQAVILGIVALLVVVSVFKIIALILDSIPFL